MIITVAAPKGGVGRTTLVRALASVGCHRGYEVCVIDADERQGAMQWHRMLTARRNRPANLHIRALCANPDQLSATALAEANSGKLVIIDTQDKVNDSTRAAMSVADAVIVPLHISFDDVQAAIQLARSDVGEIVQSRGRALPVIHVLARNSFYQLRAKALREVRTTMAWNGQSIAAASQVSRLAYREMQTGNTLYCGRNDPKAINESEAIFDEIFDLAALHIAKHNAAEDEKCHFKPGRECVSDIPADVSPEPAMPKRGELVQPVTTVEDTMAKEDAKIDPVPGAEKRSITIRYDAQRARQLKVYSALTGLRLNAIFSEALDEWFDQNEDKLPLL